MKAIGREGMSLGEIHLVKRRQIGEEAWAQRLEEARRRETILLAVRERLEAGDALSRAVEFTGSGLQPSTIRRWMERFEAEGIAGLIPMEGRLPQGHPDPVIKPRTRISRRPRSFIKWAGSKTGALDSILPAFPKSFRRYYEPMVGSGIVFFALSPKSAVLGDLNPEIMGAFEVIRDRPGDLCEALRGHVNTSEHYHLVRAQDPDTLSPMDRAARFIYLNKTCFNGMYRVNKQGRFNVPYGRIAHANICDDWAISWTSERLQGANLRLGTYRETLADAGPDDLVYLDPPYLVPKVRRSRAHLYQPEAFDLEAHEDLARFTRELMDRGCHVVISNSDLPEVRELYSGFEIVGIEVRRPINRNARGREGHRELVIVGKPNRPLRPRRTQSIAKRCTPSPVSPEEAAEESVQVSLPLRTRSIK